MERAYRLFKILADQKKDILDEDLLAIIHHGTIQDIPITFGLEQLRVECGGAWSAATVTMKIAGSDSVSTEGSGDGPIAAAFDAVDRAVGWHVELVELSIRAATPGGDAIGEATLRAKIDGKTFTGRGASTDNIDAAVRAYLHALNKAAHERQMGAEASQRPSEIWGV
jgi:2-isopropylmalate synthase